MARACSVRWPIEPAPLWLTLEATYLGFRLSAAKILERRAGNFG
jgi:hypothetical protein